MFVRPKHHHDNSKTNKKKTRTKISFIISYGLIFDLKKIKYLFFLKQKKTIFSYSQILRNNF